MLKADPIKSDRSIAETVGASPTAVGKVRANVQGGHNTERTEKTARKARGRKPASNKLKLDHDKPDDVQASAAIEDAQDGMSAAEAPPTKPGLDEDIARINAHWEDLERNFIKMIWCLVRTWQDFQLDRLVAVAPDRLEAEDITQLAAWLTDFARLIREREGTASPPPSTDHEPADKPCDASSVMAEDGLPEKYVKPCQQHPLTMKQGCGDGRAFWNRFQKGSRHGAAVPRSDRGDVRRSRSRATDHRSRRRIQAVHRRSDPFDGEAGNAARLSPAQGGARAGHHPVGVDR